MGARSGIRRLAESGSARLRLPTTREGPPEAVLINTAGGVAGGDLVSTEALLGPGADLVLTTSAAERIYRSDGDAAEISTSLTLGPDARLDWIPQETIVFDRARVRRRLEIDLDPTATALLLEATVFGRAAMSERVEHGAYRDVWRVRRGGALVYADTLRLEGRIADLLARPGMAGGRHAFATLLYVAPDAEVRLDEARRHLADGASECGASAWTGLLAMRWLAHDIATLRADVARFMTLFRGRPLPRVWHL